MKEDTRKGTCMGRVQDTRLAVNPMKKGLNGLTARTDRRAEAVTGKQGVIFFLLSEGKQQQFLDFFV